MRNIITFAFVCLAAWGTDCTKPGVQVRMTSKGTQYLADVGKQKLRDQLLKTTFNEHGKSGHVEFWLTGTRISSADFPTVQLTPISKVGIKAVVSGARVAASEGIRYKYKRGIIRFSDHIGVIIDISSVSIDATVKFSATSKGEPTISLASCTSNIGSVNIKFTGSWKKFIYNLFRGLLERKMKALLNEKLCGLLRKEIETTARAELETFPVVQKIDKWAEIDYRLTSPPAYASDYMDVFLKGEFKSVQGGKESNLTVPAFQTTAKNDKMLYLWLSDYTVNTAGEVYQRSKEIDVQIEQWDKKLPKAIRDQLNTSRIQAFIPNLKKYPNLPMAVHLLSEVAPKASMNEGKIGLSLVADTITSVKKKDGKLLEVFVLRLKIATSLNVSVVDKKITGTIKTFTYNASVIKSDIGKIDTTLFNSPFVKTMVEGVVISRANAQLKRGFPLPQLKHAEFRNVAIKLQKNAIQIGLDIYKKIRFVPDGHDNVFLSNVV